MNIGAFMKDEILESIRNKKATIGIVGLGYVGLPLAVEFGKKFKTVGFDISAKRIEELKSGLDRTLEVDPKELSDATKLSYVSNSNEIKGLDFYIVTVPTPIDEFKRPLLKPLLSASETVGKVLKKNSIVIYESTVYPGCTEEECVPILERHSGLKFNEDFYCGYSPERINPGDKAHRLSTIKKVVSGSTKEIGEIVNLLYSEIITAGTHLTSSIKVAEAAKVIENSQRDINIAFVNELAKLFNIMNIDTTEVLEAAGTKWNFLPFRPGLVGGHCIGVDPYYLTHKSVQLGYHPEIILAGRRLNDGMGTYVAGEFIKELIKRNHSVHDAKLLVLGITFKENCPDIRNSRVIDIINELKTYHCQVDVYDPWADKDEVLEEYGIKLMDSLNIKTVSKYEGCIIAVAHDEFKKLPFDEFKHNGNVLYDVKGILGKKMNAKRL